MVRKAEGGKKAATGQRPQVLPGRPEAGADRALGRREPGGWAVSLTPGRRRPLIQVKKVCIR